MPGGVHTTMVVDCCHSGSIGDLPYIWPANARSQKIETFFDTDTYEEALAKDASADNAVEERMKAKAERKMQREALRKKKREEAERENVQPPVFAQAPTVTEFIGFGRRKIMAAKQALLQKANLATQFGAATTITTTNRDVTTTTTTSAPMMDTSSDHSEAMAKQGGGTVQHCLSVPVMVTPEQTSANNAEEERKKAKALRKMQREALRKIKREVAERENVQPPVAARAPTVIMPSSLPANFVTQFGAATTITTTNRDVTTNTTTSAPMMDTSPEHAEAMAMQGGGTVQHCTSVPVMVTPEQTAEMAKQEGGTVQYGAPIMVTPEQAAAMIIIMAAAMAEQQAKR
jgi:hypothetical protein